jgi:Integrase core domain
VRRETARFVGEMREIVLLCVVRVEPALSSSTPTLDVSPGHKRCFAQLARTNRVVLAVGRTGECWDNAGAESFFATIKRELIETRAWPTRSGLRCAVFDYIAGWYNTRRPHSSLGYRCPA